MKSNPYVGWFRHSPPSNATSAAARNWVSEKWQGLSSALPTRRQHWHRVPSFLSSSKNSPHVGWFRHAPPSRIDSVPPTPLLMLPAEQQFVLELIQSCCPTTTNSKDKIDNLQQDIWKSMTVSGHLPGGGKEYLEGTKSHSYMEKNQTGTNDFVRNVSAGTFTTANALTQLASWFLFPVAYDSESSGYHSPGGPAKSNKDERGVLDNISPYLPTFLEEPLHKIPEDAYPVSEDELTECDDDDNGEDVDEDDRDDSHSDDSISTPPIPQSLDLTKDLSLSVSSLAEAYYAHQAAKDYATPSALPKQVQAPPPPPPQLTLAPSPPLEEPSPEPHQLDYVITQMDIARMSRNASRHLDVQSILNLPVITYFAAEASSGNNAKINDHPSASASTVPVEHRSIYGFSWTIVDATAVAEAKVAAKHAAGGDATADIDFCVICLEHFVNGDRLRVLPCDHSFHVGCIDRWLAGSQSFEECYTSGCPTCKKHATSSDNEQLRHRLGKDRSSSMDGSVPSWAFAQLGSALVAQQQQSMSHSNLHT